MPSNEMADSDQPLKPWWQVCFAKSRNGPYRHTFYVRATTEGEAWKKWQEKHPNGRGLLCRQIN